MCHEPEPLKTDPFRAPSLRVLAAASGPKDPGMGILTGTSQGGRTSTVMKGGKI